MVSGATAGEAGRQNMLNLRLHEAGRDSQTDGGTSKMTSLVTFGCKLSWLSTSCALKWSQTSLCGFCVKIIGVFYATLQCSYARVHWPGMSSELIMASLMSTEWDFDTYKMCVKLCLLKVFKCIIVSNVSRNDTWADLDEPIVLDEDGVTGQVAVDDGRVTGVEITAEEEKENPHKSLLVKTTWLRLLQRASRMEHWWKEETYLRADRICVHHLFKACETKHLIRRATSWILLLRSIVCFTECDLT